MDNLYFKKLPSEAFPTVSGNNVAIVETASGKLYRCDSSGAKRLMSVDEEHPVGDLYIQFDGTPTPAAKYGGTWVEDTTYTGLTLVGSGAGYTLGATGGEHTHTMTVEELVPHSHKVLAAGGGNDGNASRLSNAVLNGESTDWFVQSTGGGQPFNIMQPYKVITIWKRTA